MINNKSSPRDEESRLPFRGSVVVKHMMSDGDPSSPRRLPVNMQRKRCDSPHGTLETEIESTSSEDSLDSIKIDLIISDGATPSPPLKVAIDFCEDDDDFPIYKRNPYKYETESDFLDA